MKSVFPVILLVMLLLWGCSQKREEALDNSDDRSLKQVLYVQSLYNHNPGEDIVPEIQAVVDSMRKSGRNPYYFAAVNVLIDRLFSEGRFSEADTLAVKMKEEADEDADSLSMAMAKRVRAQMLYKLFQPSKAFEELSPAALYISDPYSNGSNFGTATSIQEWLWIISRDLGDTVIMNQAGLNYARMVDENTKINNWTDSTGHYPVTALSFKANDAFSKGDIKEAKALLDSAQTKILPSLPSRAYEHFYAVRCKVRAANSDWSGALADADTLIATHKDFPWFYLKDLRRKADILNSANHYKESVEAYKKYVTFRDSLSNEIMDQRLKDLSLLYRSEIDREHKRTERFRWIAFGTIVFLLLVLLVLALLKAMAEKKRNRLLVERLKEFDRVTEGFQSDVQNQQDSQEMSAIERLDRFMFFDRPYTDPALSRKELAEFAGISQEALGQLIKNEKGTSVRNYINSFRLEEARHILGSDSNQSISEIAVNLGFGTARTLQRAFKERYDMSPSQYRDASKEIKDSDKQ